MDLVGFNKDEPYIYSPPAQINRYLISLALPPCREPQQGTKNIHWSNLRPHSEVITSTHYIPIEYIQTTLTRKLYPVIQTYLFKESQCITNAANVYSTKNFSKIYVTISKKTSPFVVIVTTINQYMFYS